MEAAKFPYSTTTATTLHPPKSSLYHKRLHGMMRVHAGRDYEGKLVDENMITLRIRIRELKSLLHTRYGDGDELVPSHWMEWERKHYVQYNKGVYEAIGLLQNYLMNTRPCLGLGMAALVALSVPISTGVVFFFAMEILSGMLHLI